jgi:hypothetical protein
MSTMTTIVDSPYELPISFLFAAERLRTLYSTTMSTCIQRFNYHVERGDTLFSIPLTGLPIESLRQVAESFISEFLHLVDWPEKTMAVTKREENEMLILDFVIDLHLLLLAAPQHALAPITQEPAEDPCDHHKFFNT